MFLTFIPENLYAFIIFGLGAFLLTSLLVGLSLLIQFFIHIPNSEKTSPYECGFQPFSSVLHPYTIHYYLVSLIFILFDIEIVFLIPIIFIFYTKLTLISFVTIVIFNIILWIGYLIEYHFKFLSFTPSILPSVQLK